MLLFQGIWDRIEWVATETLWLWDGTRTSCVCHAGKNLKLRYRPILTILRIHTKSKDCGVRMRYILINVSTMATYYRKFILEIPLIINQFISISSTRQDIFLPTVHIINNVYLFFSINRQQIPSHTKGVLEKMMWTEWIWLTECWRTMLGHWL